MRNLAIALLVTTSLFLGACGGPSGGGGSGGPEGVYMIDAELMGPEIEKAMGPMMEGAMKMMEMLPADKKAEAMKKIEDQKSEMMKEFQFELTLSEDGTFVVKEKDGVKAKGSWRLDGKTMHIKTTEENGKTKEDPEELQGTYEGDSIRFKPQADMPFDLVFKRK